VTRWTEGEEAILRDICRQALKQGLRTIDAAVTAAERLGRGVQGCRVRVIALRLMRKPYRGRAPHRLAYRPDDAPAGVEPTLWGRPLSWFRPEGGDS